jgi:hypothetical protein
VTGGSRDGVNVEEGVRIDTPAAGLWTVRVEGHDVPLGPQPFGLVVTGRIGGGAAALALDRATYGATSNVTIQLTDANAGGSANVSIASSSEPGGEVVHVTGTGGVLTGTIHLTPFASGTGDGALRIVDGDALTATYVDANPPATLTATAAVRIQTPVITNVHTTPAGTGAVTVQWTTDADADSRVDYGTTATLGSVVAVAGAVHDHAVTLTGLVPGQTYYFDVSSHDPLGNQTRDNVGGLHYRFTVGPPSDVLLVFDGATFERADRYTSAFTSTGWSYDVWMNDASETPRLGNTSTGMRAYKAVWWQNSVEHYPPFSDAALDSVAAYMSGGGRLAVTGHDVAWANQSPTSSYYTPARAAWLQNTLHTQFTNDPGFWSGCTGIAGDPISGDYAGTAPYTPFRNGACGDEVTPVPGSGTANVDWMSGDGSPAPAGFRWESAGAVGSPGSGVWGGTPSRLATMFFEWSALAPGNDPSSIREEVLQNTIVWLIGRDKPHVTVTGPTRGRCSLPASASVSWGEYAALGSSIAARTIEYSLDGGASWTTITTNAGPSPYVWVLTNVPNSIQALVRVRVTDNGSPALSAADATDAVFTIAHAGGDVVGPVVVAGSARTNPMPIDNQKPATLLATLSDVPTGGATVAAAEWSYGDAAAPAGTGTPMNGGFGTTSATATASLTTASFVPGVRSLWVRGRDALGNWGAAAKLAVVVNGQQPLAVGEGALEWGSHPRGPIPRTAARGSTTRCPSVPPSSSRSTTSRAGACACSRRATCRPAIMAPPGTCATIAAVWSMPAFTTIVWPLAAARSHADWSRSTERRASTSPEYRRTTRSDAPSNGCGGPS